MESTVPVARIESVELPAEVSERADATTAGLAFLPSRIEGGKAVYSEHSMMLVKQLKALGADVAFADAAEERTFEVRKSALTATVLTLALGIATNASWDLLKEFIRRRREKAGQLSITYVDLSERGGPARKAWAIEGDSESVIQAIDRLRDISDDAPVPSGPVGAAIEQRTFEAAGSDEDLHRAYLKRQVIERRAEADALMDRARSLLADPADANDIREAEEIARQALASYRSSLDWAEDTEYEDDAHRRLDAAGRWVRENFQCFLDRDGKSYRQTCPVALGHNRIGLTPIVHGS